MEKIKRFLDELKYKLPIVKWYYENKKLTEENLRLTMTNDMLRGEVVRLLNELDVGGVLHKISKEQMEKELEGEN